MPGVRVRRRPGARGERRAEGEARGPRVAEPARHRPRPRPPRLVAAERARLGEHAAHAGALGAHAGRGHVALQDLREVVVHREERERPHHRVVGAEGDEPLAGGERRGEPARPGRPAFGARHELVGRRVRVPPVDEPLAVDPRVELTPAEREPLEIERGGEPHAAAGERQVGHHHRLRDGRLGAPAAVVDGRRVRALGDRLRAQPRPAAVRRAALSRAVGWAGATPSGRASAASSATDGAADGAAGWRKRKRGGVGRDGARGRVYPGAGARVTTGARPAAVSR
jgi:hypothetical protein